jgi:tetratricopeptide (TPR) repeat protein
MSKLRKLAGVCLALAGISLVTNQVAFADAKYSRKTMDVKVQQTERTKKLEVKKAESIAQPEITADQYLEVETLVQNIRDELIEEYKGAIDDTEDDDPRKAELMFRLAEAYSQKQRYFHSIGMETANKIDKETNAGKKSDLVNKRKKLQNEENKWLAAAVKSYLALAGNEKFKSYARMDEVLFFLAYTLQQAGRKPDAFKVYQRLTKDYPQSKFIPDAYLAIADQFFADSNLDEAERFYDKVLKFPKAPVYAYALYKKGWVSYNQSRAKDSYAAWSKVVELTQRSKKDVALNKAAKKDCVRAYAEFGAPDLAYKAFQRIDSDYAQTMYGFLGEFYLDQGKMDKVIYVYRDLMTLDPKNKEVCNWEYTVVRAMLTIGTPEQKVKELTNLTKLYGFIVQNKILKDANLNECRDNAEATVRELTLVWHQEGVKTLNYTTLGYVHSLYKLYMDNFPETPDAPSMQFYYSELLWMRAEGEKNQSLASSRWEEAAIEYTKVVEMNKVDPKLVKEAAYASVLSWKNSLAVDVGGEPPPVDEKAGDVVEKPQEIPEKQQKMIAAFDVYIKYVKDPNDEELVTMKFLRARILWRYKHFAEAVPLFVELLRKYPKHETTEFSITVLLDSLNRAGMFDELLTWVDELLSPKWASFMEEHDDTRANLERIKRQSMRKRAEKLEKEGKYYDCGTAYVDIFQRYANAGGNDMHEVLYNAGVCFEKAKAFQNAIIIREELVKRYPKENTAQKSLYALGANKAAIGEFKASAEYFEKYAKQFGGEKDAHTALSNAVFFRKGVGDDEVALNDTKDFVKAYINKQPAEAANAFFSMAGIYEKNRKYDDLVDHLSEYLKRFGTKGGVDRQIVAHVKIGEVLWRQSCPVRGPGGACVDIKRQRANKAAKKSKKKEKRTQCGPEDKIKLTVIKRKPALAKEARGHFEAAVKLWKGGKAANEVPGADEAEKGGRAAEMTYWLAAAKFYLAEDKYESFLDIKFPEKLNFDPAKPKVAKESVKKFKKWIEDKSKALQSAKNDYMAIVDLQPHWGVASAARVGQMYQNYSDAVFTAEIPKEVQAYEDASDAYCDALGEESGKLEDESVKAYTYCLDTALKLSWFNEWSQTCESELSQIRPQDFPSAAEIRATPDEIPLTLDVTPVVADIKK